jgi:uncharacterized phage-associated protein
MSLTYQFNLEKAVQAMAFFVERLREVEKIKLVKLVFLSDRQHFIHTGAPITGDRQVAMPYGPVPSATLDAINGCLPSCEDAVFRYINVKNNKITLKKSPGRDALSPQEVATLEKVLKTHGATEAWALARETERLQEYVTAFVEGTSTTIPYESIAKTSGDPRRYRHNRAVIPGSALASMGRSIGAGNDI